MSAPVLRQALPPEPASAAAARQLTEDTLRAWQHEDLVDVATLLVSELVTNAVLHAGSEIGLRVAATPGGVRVEVADASAALPARRSYDEEATVGRGLSLVALLSSAWGVEPRAGGKVVWFQVGGAPSAPSDDDVLSTLAATAREGADVPSLAPAGPAPASDGEDGVTVHLRGLPVKLYLAAAEHDEALLRELALLDLQLHEAPAGGTPVTADGGRTDQARPLAAPLPLRMPAVEAQLATALDDDRAMAQVQAVVSRTRREECAELLTVLDEADELSRHGSLLLPPALPEVRACRRWYLGEIIAQLDGEEPTPWSAPEGLDHTEPGAVTVPDAAVVLDSLHDAVVAGDQDNRIVYANPAAERLLGWPADELVGRRITTIVPEHLREAHVVGYSRYLVTGAARLLGRPVRVPALRRDGSEVAVELVLSLSHGLDGRRLFVGSLRDVSPRAVVERTVTGDSALAAATEIGALLGSTGAASDLASVAPLALAALGERLGCQAAMLWTPEPGGLALRCTAGWDDGSAGGAGFRSASAHRRFEAGVGIPGRVWASQQPLWISDVVADANFPRANLALEHGLRSVLAFPVVAAGGVHGVIELFSGEVADADPAVLAVTAAVGRHLGAYADRGQ